MIDYEQVPHEIHQVVKVSQFRRHMAHYIAMVRYGDDYVCIKRKRMDPVYLVSSADFDLIRKRQGEVVHKEMVEDDGCRSSFWQVLRRQLKRDRAGV